MGNYNRSYITLAEFQALQSWKVPYTGFVKGVGYTYPEYFPMEVPRDSSLTNPAWGDWMFFPVYKQVWDRSSEAVFRSMQYKPEDILNRIKKDNNNGTITFTVQDESITVSSDTSKHKVRIQIEEDSSNYGIKIAIQNLETNECLFKEIRTNDENNESAIQLSSKVEIEDIASGLNAGVGTVSGIYTSGLKSTVTRIHRFRPITYSDGVIFKPALPGYRLGNISGKFIEKSYSFMGKLGNLSGGIGVALTFRQYSAGQISTSKMIFDQTFNIIGFLYLPGFLVSTTYTAVDTFYPNGWEGLWDDICREQYNMYMNQVSDDGVMMAPWLMGK